MHLYIWKARLGERGDRRRDWEREERRAREGKEWERGELYMHIDQIIVYYTYVFVYFGELYYINVTNYTNSK